MHKSLILVLLLASSVQQALAHSETHQSAASVLREQTAWGIAGDSGQVTRTIELRMSDTMRFTPDQLQVKRGETVRLILHNDGRMMHEFVLGTERVLNEHAALMLRFPGMQHAEPYMAHVAPGQSGEIIWTFNNAGEFDFACLIAGHFQAGMRGRVQVVN